MAKRRIATDELQVLVDNRAAMTCVVSVEDLGDGRSGDIASAVLETGLKLRGTDDYRETMKDIIRTKKPAGSCPAGY